MKQVVITGIGAFSPLAANAKDTWEQLLAGSSGVRTIPNEGLFAECPTNVNFAGMVACDPTTILTPQQCKRLDPSSQYALIAAREAVVDAGFPLKNTDTETAHTSGQPDAPRKSWDSHRVKIEWATGIGGIWTLLSAWDNQKAYGPRKVMPLTVPMLMPNAPAAAIGMELGVHGGIHTSVAACASSAEAVARAYSRIQSGDADIVIAGGCEASIHPLTLAAFASMRALSTLCDNPQAASRPYDASRDGFVLAEGSAALVLESEEHALARGAKIYAQIASAAITSDAYHITAPEPAGKGAAKAIEQALTLANARPEDIAHINPHATSTPVGDIAEYNAFRAVFGSRLPHIPISATKASTGHLLGAAGAIEAIFTILALQTQILPPNINYKTPDAEIALDVVTKARKVDFAPDALALSTSFGFGGHNVVLAIRKYT